jgi:hypothetical protein
MADAGTTPGCVAGGTAGGTASGGTTKQTQPIEIHPRQGDPTDSDTLLILGRRLPVVA